jgi:hypothetical protein
MTLPNPDRAVVDSAKLVEYCLNPGHPRGRHKARVFAAALGLTAAHALELRSALLGAARARDAIMTFRDFYGTRYTIDFMMEHDGKRAVVRSHWIVLAGEDHPRLTTCYVA